MLDGIRAVDVGRASADDGGAVAVLETLARGDEDVDRLVGRVVGYDEDELDAGVVSERGFETAAKDLLRLDDPHAQALHLSPRAGRSLRDRPRV